MRKLKKAFSLTLALAMCLGLMAVPAAAVNPGEEWVGDFVVNGDTLVGYYGDGGAVTIPDGITTIGLGAFEDCAGLTSVTIPNSVTAIGINAFSGCTGLTSVTIPNSVTGIQNGAFWGCTGLTSVTIPNSVTSTGTGVFSDCTGLTSVTVSNSITYINNALFKGCTSLTSVTIPNSVTTIAGAAFENCTSLTSVTIPSSVTAIGNSAFENCTGLTSVTISDGVISIREDAFRGCTSLTSVTIPSSVTNFGENIFGKCASLTSMTILSDKVYLGRYLCFDGCPSLTDIYYIGSKAQWKERGGDVAESNWDNYSYGYNPTIHFNSTGPSTTQPTTPPQPQQPAGTTASPTNDKLEVNGNAADPTVYKIGDSNYFKIRDVAALLNGTEKQFAVGYDGTKNAVTATTGQGYEKQSGDLTGAAAGGSQTADPSNDAIYVDGQKITAEVYKINGSNYFKLRDLGKALNFYVGWSADRGMYIETNKPYSE
ncbi:MAG: leucine-rich repeat protein [Lawsonibacter sp.]|nr:leucine-rich repeat protein [Lawsonibacter sp.]